MSMQIENQGRHSGEGFGELAEDIWSNKPLLIVFAVGLFLVVYMIARNKGTITAPNSGTANPAGSNGTYLIVNDIPVPNITINNPTPTTQGGNPPPRGIFCQRGYHWDGTKCVPNIIPTPGPPPVPVPVPPPPPPPPPPAERTVVVTPWPTQDSTLWGIAQHYDYGSNWQPIYQLNRQKIGPDPNLLHVGLVLTLP